MAVLCNDMDPDEQQMILDGILQNALRVVDVPWDAGLRWEAWWKQWN